MKNILLITMLSFLSVQFSSAQKGMVFVKGGSYTTKREVNNDGKWVVMKKSVNDFWMDTIEVTVGQYAKFIEATGYVTETEKKGVSTVYGGKLKENVNWRHDIDGNIRPKSDYDYPVVHIVAADAIAYAKWCNKRLPTEDEWEFAARGGVKETKDYRYSGSNKPSLVAWWNDGDASTGSGIRKGGQLKPNALGIYDMTGNVSEMCSDLRFDGKAVVNKGGSFLDDDRLSNYNYKISMYYYYSGFMNGFRCVKDVK